MFEMNTKKVYGVLWPEFSSTSRNKEVASKFGDYKLNKRVKTKHRTKVILFLMSRIHVAFKRNEDKKTTLINVNSDFL